jgi:hypothetical protein
MANTLALAGAAAAVVYFGFIKPKRARERAAAEESDGPTVPRILFTTECEWDIPDAWWTDVGSPKFAGILEGTLADAPTWEGKKIILGSPAMNSHLVAHKVLQGETPEGCPLPAVDADVFNPPVGLTRPQELMINLFAHMINHVEASLVRFVQSEGTIVEFPVPLPDEG